MSEAKGLKPVGDWFAAEVEVPMDVAVLNFVVQYYEHYDNNYGADFKAVVQVDPEGRCVHPAPELRVFPLARRTYALSKLAFCYSCAEAQCCRKPL